MCSQEANVDDFDEIISLYHGALGDFVNGDSGTMRGLFAADDDTVLCNPFRPFAHGANEVAEALAQAASHFAAGEYSFETIEKHRNDWLGYLIEAERYSARLDGKDGSGRLRATTIFRRDSGGWKVVHRHADPIIARESAESLLEKA
jgi:ketosteroid isomerase-like protein